MLGKELSTAFGEELDRIRADVLATRGGEDARYIHAVIAAQRGLEAGGRLALTVSILPPAWCAGTAMLSLAKILENMELGHNILHGQWDWMGDPAIHSATWEWDFLTPAEAWKHTHNHLHHTWTNVVGRDRDLGYVVFRMSGEQSWRPRHLAQPLYNFALAPLFEWGIALYDLEPDLVASGRKPLRTFVADLTGLIGKAAHQLAKDYVLFPVLAGPSALPCLLGNLTANTVRNLWSHTIIFCGHFPGDVRTFSEERVHSETRGEWYLRQIQGSANIKGGRLFHILSGHLGYQIEHHAFPDLPSNRYAQIAPRVRALCEKYDIPYVTGPLWRQCASTWGRILRFAVPLH
nr:acyl-CoA desaturase [Streptomyces sp. N35]